MARARRRLRTRQTRVATRRGRRLRGCISIDSVVEREWLRAFYFKRFLDGLVEASSLSLLKSFFFFSSSVGLVGHFFLLIWRAGHSTWSIFFLFCTSICAFSLRARAGVAVRFAFEFIPTYNLHSHCILIDWCFAFAPSLFCRVRSCIHRLPACLLLRPSPFVETVRAPNAPVLYFQSMHSASWSSYVL